MVVLTWRYRDSNRLSLCVETFLACSGWGKLGFSELMGIDFVKVVPGSQCRCSCQYSVHWGNGSSVGSDSKVKWEDGRENLQVIRSICQAGWEFQIKVHRLNTTLTSLYCLFLHWDRSYWMKVISGYVVISTSQVRLNFASTTVKRKIHLLVQCKRNSDEEREFGMNIKDIIMKSQQRLKRL